MDARPHPRPFPSLDTVHENSHICCMKNQHLADVDPGGLATVDRIGNALWRARDFASAGAAGRTAAGIRTGFAALDAVFFGGGWPRAGLTELLCPMPGIGELGLILPALATLSKDEARWIAWIEPPFVPYAPALAAAGVDLAKVLLIAPGTRAETLWALEQALIAGACGAVLGWPSRIDMVATRRLLLAARQGGAWGCLFRPIAAAREASAAELRLRLSPLPERRLRVDVLKRRGGWPLRNIELRLDAAGDSGEPA